MSRRLIVIRHAKAGDGLVDHDRPLTTRGEQDATRLGEWLAAHNFRPDRAVVSTARRTRQTWSAAVTALSQPVPVDYDERIYDNSVEDLLDVLHSVATEVDTVALVGHSPGLQDLVIHLDGSGGTSELGRKARAFFPTSAVAILEIGSNWAHLGGGDGAIARLVGPDDF